MTNEQKTDNSENKYWKPGDFLRMHTDPVWKRSRNTIFNAFIDTDDGIDRWEQLWGAKADAGTIIIVCIPISAYDINLGDEVEINEDGVFTRVVTDGGHYTYRVWFGGQTEETQNRVVAQLETMKPIMERASASLIALSMPGRERLEAMVGFLRSCAGSGLLEFETGRTVNPEAEVEPRLEPPPDPEDGPPSTPDSRRSGSFAASSELMASRRVEVDDAVVEHFHPIAGDRADCLLHAKLGVFDGTMGWEQLWGQATDRGTFYVCCIPFYAKEIQFGDEVELDEDFVVQRVVSHNKQFSFRLDCGYRFKLEILMEDLHYASPLSEPYFGNTLALSIKSAYKEQVTNYLHDRVHEGLLVYDYEETVNALNSELQQQTEPAPPPEANPDPPVNKLKQMFSRIFGKQK